MLLCSCVLHYKHWLHQTGATQERVSTCPLYPGMCSLAAMRIQTSEGANNKCTFTNCLRSCALTSQRCCLHPNILQKLRRNAPACAYGFNVYVHCFSRTFKKTNEWEMLNQIMHRQRVAGRRASIFSLSFSLTQAVDLLKANRTQRG